MAQAARGGKRVAPRAKRRKKGRSPLLLPGILAVVVVLLLGVKLGLERFSTAGEETREKHPAPEWVTKEYLPVNPFSRPGTGLEEVNGVVVHYVGNPGTTAEQNRSFFAGLAEQTEGAENTVSASSHFLIGLDEEIIQCIPLDEWAYCTGERNRDTISIECCHPDDGGAFTDATYQSLLRLVRWLQEEFDLDGEQIIRHYDVTGKECPRYYVQHPEAWEQFKADLEQTGT